MGVRKNAKFLSAVERENFVKACVLMKADIVNPAAPVADRYSKWDEAVAIHRMIQNANAPGGFNNINFGHGGLGSYSFLSWHRFFLSWFEQNLRSYVPGVDLWLPYWDWSDPAPLMSDTFLGPNGSGGLHIVSSGYFAPNKPGTGGNPTPLPAWWPAALTGWNLANGFGALTGPLTRNISGLAGLPTTADLQATLARTTYSSFQNTLESGAGLVSGHQMHNGLHTWFGAGTSHMATLTGSVFDPFFFLHHCNIDRLWAMWQMDGHANLYPAAGANPQHGPNDIMYPWTGGTPGYSSNLSFGVIVMPDFSGLGIKRNIDMLDHRALGYTYDTMAVIGIGLDRTGSMTGMTPDPMTGVGNVTKWEAAKRGVSAFMQDCETVQASTAIYVTAGVKTFRTLVANTFTPVFPGTPYGLIKNGTAYSKTSFDNAVAVMSPGGSTPLADALLDVEATLVAPPFGWVPADEQRYIAMLTDGMLTSGAPLASIPNNSLTQTAVFAMGFGTPADVDYPTLANIVAKGKTLGIQQVFHGENAGTIDKFYSNALANAIGFVAVFDPVLELFAGEHSHMEFSATSADDAFLITAQGMDYEDANWSYQLIGPNQTHVYGDGMLHAHGVAGHGRMPSVTAHRNDGRLSLVLQRDSADSAMWVGTWTLMVAYRARDMSAMVMTDLGELMWPVTAGPVRGPRYSRVLQSLKDRKAARNVVSPPRHEFDVRPASTNNSTRQACSVVVNVYAQTRLRLELNLKSHLVAVNEAFEVVLGGDVLSGSVSSMRGLARLAAPTQDIAALVARVKPTEIPDEARLQGSQSLRFDTAHLLALLERKNPKIAIQRDEIAKVAVHEGGPLHVHVKDTSVPGVHHLGIYVEGLYCPEQDSSAPTGHDHEAKHEAAPSTTAPTCTYERFTRLLNISIAIGNEKPKGK